MWIFGQVWFACLVGFAVGVLLDWVVRVRPLSNRVAELEARLAADARSARSDGEYGRSVFDRGPFGAANASPDGFITERNRGGLLTPSGGGTDLLDVGEPEPVSEPQSGVEDFPGVARLSGVWDEAEDAARAAPEPWQPIGPAAAAAEEAWRDNPAGAEPATGPEPWLPSAEPDDQPTQVSSWMTEQPPSAESAEEPPEADDQYLEFLRAGANHAPTEPGPDDEAELGTRGEMADPGSGEVTSVLPQIEGYEAYESYADEYEQNGYQRNGYREESADQSPQGYDETNGAQFAEYQPEEVAEPAEPGSPLPRRRSGESLRFAPFEIPFEAHDAGVSDARPRGGELTPIEEGGFQPFSKPSDVVSADTATDGAWIGDDGQLVGGYEGHQVANGSHSLLESPVDESGSSWFDMSEANPQSSAGGGESGLTQRMLPVSRPDLDHPDLLRESVFGTETDTQYADEDRIRSLFEPVVQADELEDDYQAPAYEPPSYSQPAFEDQQQFAQQPFEQQPFQEQQFQGQNFEDQPFEAQNFAGQDFDQPAGFGSTENAFETTGELPTTDPAPGEPVSGEFYDQTQPPRPIRVRTGVDGPVTQKIPALQPDDGQGADQPADEPGPFGPGSALPHPDGSAPTDGFTVKARTSSMVFHTQSSPFFDRLEPQVWFRTPEDAQRAGFTSWERPRSW